MGIVGQRLNRAIAPPESLEHDALRHDLIHGPAGRAADIHVLDEADFRVVRAPELDQVDQLVVVEPADHHRVELELSEPDLPRGGDAFEHVRVPRALGERDRKSTRLNSSHVATSYAVFCLKKTKRMSGSRRK